MTNKDNLKNSIDKDFNKIKNYDAIIKKTERVEKMNKQLKFAFVPICLLAIILGSVFLNNNNDLQDKPIVKKYNNSIYINNFDEKIGGALKLDVDIKSVQLSEISERFQFATSLIIPSDLNQKDIYALYISDDGKVEDRKYDILHDYVIHYTSENQDRGVRISFSEKGRPIRDYLLGDVEKLSKINNIDVEISQYKDLFLATFKHDNLFFDIETNGLNEGELIVLLESVIE